jgi:alkylation response protein AidB-like acyl-CoA dehydrogenase
LEDFMSVVSVAANVPSVEELEDRSLNISRFVREYAEQAERTRQVSSEAISRMREAGIFRTMQPAIYGGYEYGFDALLRVVAPIGAACGSTGWVSSLGIVHQWLIAAFPKQAQDEYFSDPDALAFGSYPPIGKVTPVEGGFRLSGTWAFTSGCDHARWLVLGGLIPPIEEGASVKPTFFLVPISDVCLDDNWFTMGLAATGSKNTVVRDAFVPAHRTVSIVDLLVGTAPGAVLHESPLYRQSLLSVLPFCLVAPLLGIADGALADFLAMAAVRTTRGAVSGGNTRMAEFATIQSRLAEATGAVEAARLLLLDGMQAALSAAVVGIQGERNLRLGNRLKQAFAARLLVQAVDALLHAAGGQGVFLDKPIQRAWRDIHAGAMHVSLTWDAVSTMYGQYALGLEPKGQY